MVYKRLAGTSEKGGNDASNSPNNVPATDLNARVRLCLHEPLKIVVSAIRIVTRVDWGSLITYIRWPVIMLFELQLIVLLGIRQSFMSLRNVDGDPWTRWFFFFRH